MFYRLRHEKGLHLLQLLRLFRCQIIGQTEIDPGVVEFPFVVFQ